MRLEDLFYSQDRGKIRVISGDIPEGFWDVTGTLLERTNYLGDHGYLDPVDLTHLRRVETLHQVEGSKANLLVGSAVGALAGLRFFGPFGAVAGGVAGAAICSDRGKVSAKLELVDGRKFVATMQPEMFVRLKSMAEEYSGAS